MTLLNILADLSNARIWMVSTCPLISKSSSPCINPLVTVPTHQLQLISHFYNIISPQIFRTLLCILLADLNKAVVRMVSTRRLISKSTSPCTNPLVTVVLILLVVINSSFLKLYNCVFCTIIVEELLCLYLCILCLQSVCIYIYI